jgi:hypothetical protein
MPCSAVVTGIVVQRPISSGRMLSRLGSRCMSTTYAQPASAGAVRKNRCSASTPPADAPSATVANSSGGSCAVASTASASESGRSATLDSAALPPARFSMAIAPRPSPLGLKRIISGTRASAMRPSFAVLCGNRFRRRRGGLSAPREPDGWPASRTVPTARCRPLRRGAGVARWQPCQNGRPTVPQQECRG